LTTQQLIIQDLAQNFWFNASATTPGNYNILVNISYTTSENNLSDFSTIPVIVNDTTPPYSVEFELVGSTPEGNVTNSTIAINVTASDNYLIKNSTVTLYDSSWALVTNIDGMNPSSQNVGNESMSWQTNFMSLANLTYHVNISIYDNASNLNQTTREITLNYTDDVAPLIDFITPAFVSGSYQTNYVLSNLTITEPYLKNVTTYLYNSTGLVNSSMVGGACMGMGSMDCYYNNFSSLPEGIYYLNATAYDTLLHVNSTATRTITIDGSAPVVHLVSPQNNTLRNNITTTHTFNVTDSSGPANCTMFWLGGDSVNITSVPVDGSTQDVPGMWTNSEGTSSWYINCTDTAGNTGTSEVWSITFDTTAPIITITNLANNTILNGASIPYNITGNVSDAIVGVNFTSFYQNGILNMSSVDYSNPGVAWAQLWNPANGVYNLTVQACDYVNNCANVSVYGITIDKINPSINSATTTNADVFYSVFDNIVNISANITDVNPIIVTANFSNLSTSLNCGNGANAILNLTLAGDGFYKGGCDISSAIASVTNPQPKIIVISAVDTANNRNNTALPIIAHNLDVPVMQSALGPGGCNQTRFGSQTTNFTRELNFSSINFVIDTEANFSCLSGGIIISSNFVDVNIINISSIDLSTQEKAAKLQQLPQNLQVNLTPPHQFGNSRVYINSTFFAELNRTSIIKFFDLPFVTQPVIVPGDGAAGVNTSTIIWASNGFSSTFNVITGNLTFTVYGFSEYDINESVKPLITINSPLAGSYLINNTPTVNVTLNGTGTEISAAYFFVNGQPIKYFNSSGNTANCINTAGSEIFNCVFTPGTAIPDNASVNLTVNAYDTGGNAPGNMNSSTALFGIDTVAPDADVYSLMANGVPYVPGTWTNGLVSVRLNCSDATSGCRYVWYYGYTSNPQFNISAPFNDSLLSYDSSDVFRDVNFTYFGQDIAGNNGTIERISVKIDRIKPNIAINSPVAFANQSSRIISMNIYTNDTNMNYTNITIYNSTGIAKNSTVNTTANNQNISISLSVGIDGIYTINATNYDLAGNINSTTRTLTVDTTFPAITYNSTTSVDGANLSQNSTYVKVDTSDTNLKNHTFVLYNSTHVVLNTTQTSSIVKSVNWTDLGDGVYYYNVSATDYANNINWTSTRMITLDTAGPSISLSESSSTRESLTIDISASDSGSGLNGTCTSNRGTVSGTTSITEIGLSCATDYTYTLTCYDNAGNSNVAASTFSTLDCASSGGGLSSTTTESQIDEGYLATFSLGELLNFKINGESHKMVILRIRNGTVDLRFSSTPMTITMANGEEKKIDLNADNLYDLFVKVTNLTNSKVTVSLKTINESVTPSEGKTTIEPIETTPGVGETIADTIKSTPMTTKLITAAIIIVLAIILYVVYRRNNKGKVAVVPQHHHKHK